MSDFVHNRHTIRLRGYDYSQDGYYFVTICTHEREWLFGEIIDGQMKLSSVGDVVNQVWRLLPSRFDIELNQFQIMPNHVHGIIVLTGNSMGREDRAPTLGQILAYFKYESTKQINCRGGVFPPQTFNKIWQRNYYEHIIRNEKEYWAIRKYIIDNPKNWDNDTENMLN